MNSNVSKILATAIALACGLALPSRAQLQFTDVRVTEEGAIKLFWNSESNAVYQVDYADELVDVNAGGTVWHPLFIDYPSHGTNTFIADAGNYDVAPEIVHPKLSPVRFYRITFVEANTSATNPIVAIATPTNGSSLFGQITVSVAASSGEMLTNVRLYIDGEEQWTSDDGTNFVINTCEWPNGPHTIFATAKSQSGLEGAANGAVITYGRAVSTYRNVTFDNLITRFDFSEPFFDPELGQTQQVTVAFAANCDWTLQIQNASSNTVRYVTGSGSSMRFDWDGTGTNGANLPNGVYSYLLTAQTNGQQMMMVGGGVAGFASATAFSAPDDSTDLWVMPETSDFAVPLALYPPGFDTNGFTIFEASQSEVQALNQAVAAMSKPATTPKLSSSVANAAQSGGGIVMDGYSGGNSQSTRGPSRKPRTGVKGTVGTFGICYKTYATTSYTSPHPPTGWPYPLQTLVAIDEQIPTGSTVNRGIWTFPGIAKDFKAGMRKAGWRAKFIKENDTWSATDIKKTSLGGYSIFNNCNFGLLMTHGSYANNTTQGNEADGVKYTYISLLDLASNTKSWVRLSDMDFGSAGPKGLRWLTMLACNVLRPANITSMINHSKLPINDNLHLLMGCETTAYAGARIGQYYSSNLVADVTIPNAWYAAASKSYQENHGGITNTVTFRTLGWQPCFSDKLSLYNDPDTSQGIFSQSQNVYVLP